MTTPTSACAAGEMERIPVESNRHHIFLVAPFSDCYIIIYTTEEKREERDRYVANDNSELTMKAQPEREGEEGWWMWWGGVPEGRLRTDLRAWTHSSLS